MTSASLLTPLAAYSEEGDPRRTPLKAVGVAAPAPLQEKVQWDLTPSYNREVRNWIGFLTGRNRSRTELWLQRSGRYAPLIREELRRRGMPQDLIYLAFIESGFSTKAQSDAAAVGIWQFIAETGRRYGLEVSTYVDERRDPVKSTRAALGYLQSLYGRFGSWYLAAAAYNTGENRVGRIMREVTGRERGTDADFWRIAKRLPSETRAYVPLMLAAGHIGKQPAKYGFRNIAYHDPLVFRTVHVPAGVRLSAVARTASVSEDIVSELNPELVRGMTPPGRAWPVRVPAGADSRLAQNSTGGLLGMPDSPGKSETATRLARYHHVRRGENLSVIAARYDTTVKTLRRLNSLGSSKILPGQRLRVR